LPHSRRRSALYMPASNARAVEKARTLPADMVILDLEDAVAPDAKAAAREAAVAAVSAGGFGDRELVVRVNAPGTDDHERDVAALRAVDVAVLVPKVDSARTLEDVARGLPDRPLWAMIETCRAVLDVAQIARAAWNVPLAGLVVGTNDIAKEMFCKLDRSRRPIWGGLTAVVMAARAEGVAVLDGVYNDFADLAGLEAECVEGAEFGFDGKTLIHPRQIEVCNRVFAPSAEEVAFARAVVDAFARPENAGANVLTIDGRMVEHLHIAGARRTIARAD
jgi:citrate lyase subunit beta / citryl-CoA lyase